MEERIPAWEVIQGGRGPGAWSLLALKAAGSTVKDWIRLQNLEGDRKWSDRPLEPLGFGPGEPILDV